MINYTVYVVNSNYEWRRLCTTNIKDFAYNDSYKYIYDTYGKVKNLHNWREDNGVWISFDDAPESICIVES